MKPEFEYGKVSNSQEVEKLGNILGQCFLRTLNIEQAWMERMEIDNLRIIRQGKDIVGGLGAIPMGQWWGGESVAMTGISGVGITPDSRGTGAAFSLMEQTIKELYGKGVGISVLYPATQRLYRKLGYEQGGSSCNWEIPAGSIQIREQPLPVKAIPINSKILYELYAKQAKGINGYLNRTQIIWESIMKPSDKDIFYSYLIGSETQPEGYIIYSQHSVQDDNILRVRDWVLLSNAAIQSFWSFLNNHRSMIDKIHWHSSIVDYLTLLLPEQNAKMRDIKRWMLRIIDVEKALSTRGYPKGIDRELHLEIKDDLIPENNGKFILSITKGSAKVTKGGKGELKLDIKGLTPLYTGLFTPQQLQLMGKLDATDTAIEIATKIFAGSSPWMADFF